jgi:hypothetical protein
VERGYSGQGVRFGGASGCWDSASGPSQAFSQAFVLVLPSLPFFFLWKVKDIVGFMGWQPVQQHRALLSEGLCAWP